MVMMAAAAFILIGYPVFLYLCDFRCIGVIVVICVVMLCIIVDDLLMDQLPDLFSGLLLILVDEIPYDLIISGEISCLLKILPCLIELGILEIEVGEVRGYREILRIEVRGRLEICRR